MKKFTYKKENAVKYNKIIKGKFIERPNRFVAFVKLDESGTVATCHVKNTGRCKELLLPGTSVYLEDHREDMGSRKLAYSLIAVEKITGKDSQILINMDSQAPNRVTKEALQSGKIDLLKEEFHNLKIISPEKTFGESRLDFYIEGDNGKKGFIEVKGVTLEDGGVAYFPDAPTERGVKHIRELIAAKEQGYEAYVLFVIQMKEIRHFSPNDKTHPQFGQALRDAESEGVHILAYDCLVKQDSLEIDSPVPVVL